MVPLLVWVGFLAIVDGARLSYPPLIGAPVLADSGEINVNNTSVSNVTNDDVSNKSFNSVKRKFLRDLIAPKTPDAAIDRKIFEVLMEGIVTDRNNKRFNRSNSIKTINDHRYAETDRNIKNGFGPSGSGSKYMTSTSIYDYSYTRNSQTKRPYWEEPRSGGADADRDKYKDHFYNSHISKSRRYAHDEVDKNVNESTEHVTERNNKRFGNEFKTKPKKRNFDNSNDDEYSKSDENVDVVNDRKVSELEDHVAEWNTKRFGYGGKSSPNKKTENAFGASNDNKYPISAENVDADRKVIESVDHVTGRNNKQFDNSLQNYSNKKTDNGNDNDSSSQFPKQKIPERDINLHVHIYNEGTNNFRRKDRNYENMSPTIKSKENNNNIPHWEQGSFEESKEKKDDISVKHYKNENNHKPYRISHSDAKIKANTEGKSFKSCKDCHFKYYTTSPRHSNKENIPKTHRNYHDTSRKHFHDDGRTYIRESHTEPRNNRHGNNYVHEGHAQTFVKYKKSKVSGYNHHNDIRTRRKNSDSMRNHGYRNNRNSFRHNKPKNYHYSSSNRNNGYLNWNHHKRNSFKHRSHRYYKKHNIYNTHHKYKGNNLKNWKSYRKPKKFVNRWRRH